MFYVTLVNIVYRTLGVLFLQFNVFCVCAKLARVTRYVTPRILKQHLVDLDPEDAGMNSKLQC